MTTSRAACPGARTTIGHGARHDELIEARRHLLLPADEERELVQRELAEREPLGHPELEAQGALDGATVVRLDLSDVADIGRMGDARKLDGPQRDVVRGAVLARGLLILPVRLRRDVPLGTRKPLVSDPCRGFGLSSTTAIEGVGAK